MSVAKALTLSDQNQGLLRAFMEASNKIILNKEEQVKLSLCCILSRGHLLIEDEPGMGKTTLVKLVGRLMGLHFQRVQFTNDLLPGDIIGSSVYDETKRSFEFHKGPIFAQLILADEVNRATPKTQSACLQAMEESAVSIDGVSYKLPEPFIFIATQNPKQNIGTFPLPESQLDRFLMKISIGYPNRDAERELLRGKSRHRMIDDIPPLMTPETIIDMQFEVDQIAVSDAIVEYIQDIIDTSRGQFNGLSPRAGIGLMHASKSYAYVEGRSYVIPEDVQSVAVACINHRLSSSEDPFGVQGEERAQRLIESVKVK